ncbi:NADH dehydrogenase subunit 6 (mitochondrion) [Muscidifurax raptorellus]|uniref:NADH dehydrogenase subunit 6 n=1 Tax=Muscidifurax raptorellus TaxID=51938 RepID=UPI001E74872F|nr:NADH dehydrogenase subunit 6 [Muscidifurax raptorellus]UAT98632.1 NADH dehydrogenase subunit 6 [Muscidifurax raptorellus]
MMKLFYIILINSLTSLTLFGVFVISISIYSNYFHPLMLCLILMLFTIFVSLDMSILSPTHWYSYIVYLIIVGGLMIIFLYFISLISNMKMCIDWYYFFLMPLKILMMVSFIIVIYYNKEIYMFWSTTNFKSIDLLQMLSECNFINYMYTFKNTTTIILMIYLFICLTLVVKIIITKKIMLRKVN